MGNRGREFDRGKIENISFKKALNFNGNLIMKAVIEIDHINQKLTQNPVPSAERRPLTT